MLRRELKILKYIRWRGYVTDRKLSEKFPYIDDYYNLLKEFYIQEDTAGNLYNQSSRERLNLAKDDIIIFLTIYGKDAVAKSYRDFWGFFLPWFITTIVAVLPVILQLLGKIN